MGEDRLRYWGISYGTLLGATYANMFPGRAGRLVLDGNVDPQVWVNHGAESEPATNTFLRLGSHLGSVDTLGQFLAHCGRAPVSRCAFSAGSPGATQAKYEALLKRLAERPVGSWTYARVVSEVRGELYTVHPGWTGLAEVLQTLWQGRAPQEPPAGPAGYPGFEQSLAVLCAESPKPALPSRYTALEWQAVEQTGAFGRWWVWANEPCTAWPARAADPCTGPWNRPTAHPVLVVNPAYDPSTPYRAGRAMAAELAAARLLTLDGYGHTALDNPSTCVKRHVVRYFLTGALPPQEARCAQDTPPFAAPAEQGKSPAGTAAPGRSTNAAEAGAPSATAAAKGAVRFPVWPLRSADLFPAWPTGATPSRLD